MFRLAIIDSVTGNAFYWNGSLTVNVFDDSGRNFDVFSLAYKEDGNDFADFAEAVERYTQE